MRKKIVWLGVIALAVAAIVVGQQIARAYSRSASTRVTALFSEQYYRSFDGRRIRAALRRHRASRAPAARDRGVRLAYRFQKIDSQTAELEAAGAASQEAAPQTAGLQEAELEDMIRQWVADGEQVFVAFEERYVAPLERIASRFPQQRFYLLTEQQIERPEGDTLAPSGAARVFALQTAGYDYLLGYYASLLLHYRLYDEGLGNDGDSGDGQRPQVAVISDNSIQNAPRLIAIEYGLQSVSAENDYTRLSVDALTNERIDNTLEKLALDNTKAIILLTAVVPRALIRGARKHNMALITRAPRRWLRGAHVAQRQLNWEAIIGGHVAPHIRNARTNDVSIAPRRGYFTLYYRAPTQDDQLAAIFARQLETAAAKIASEQLEVRLEYVAPNNR